MKWVRYILARRARGQALTCQDWEDAVQEVFLECLAAIARRFAAGPAPGAVGFRRFVGRVVRRHFSNWLRARRRAERRLDRSLPAEEALGCRLEKPRALAGPGRTGADPALLVAWGEVEARLRALALRLANGDRAFWDGLLAGAPLYQIAGECGVGYDRARGWLHKLQQQLDHLLPECAGLHPHA